MELLVRCQLLNEFLDLPSLTNDLINFLLNFSLPFLIHLLTDFIEVVPPVLFLESVSLN